MRAVDPCIERYHSLKNLKMVGAELGLPWQTVYSRLKRAGVAITGDKERYGSETDRVAARGERWFKRVIPEAEDQNKLTYQPRFDFLVRGLKVDVKTSRPRVSPRGVFQWIWSVKKQEAEADFFVCLAITSRADDAGVHRALLVPGELARRYQSIRASHDGKRMTGKWADYACTSADLRNFFEGI